MKKALKIVFLFTLILSFSSCNKSQVYKEFKTLPNYTWDRIEKGKTIIFDDVIINKEDEVYDISVHVRHTPYVTEDEIKFKMKIIKKVALLSYFFSCVSWADALRKIRFTVSGS
jgi:hypothetical protein